jgi:acyl-CoA synthetase (AMP-forming)/AMP-acid ligase II
MSIVLGDLATPPRTSGVPKGVSCRSLVRIIRRNLQAKPDLVLYRFLRNGEAESESFDCAALDSRAQSIAGYLQAKGRPGDRALLLYPSGLEFIAAFLGCLYAGVVAVPVCPPNPHQSLERLQGIVADSGARFALTTGRELSALSHSRDRIPELAKAHWVATDKIIKDLVWSWSEQQFDDDTVALLQYTSGSTGTPKGVVISHENLVHNENIISRAFQHDTTSKVAGWLPLYHDMGLIGNMLQPLFSGIPCLLMSPLAFLHRPVRWLRAISNFRATTSGAPNFAFDLCTRRITREQCEGLDLSSWDLAYNGSEPVRTSTMQRFAEKFAPYGFRLEAFYPCYGMAEATLFATGGTKSAPPIACVPPKVEPIELPDLRGDEGDAQTLVSCGRAWEDTRVVIVDPKSRRPCLAGETGELWIAGRSVAQGYWNRPVESKRTFHAYLAKTNEGPFLRTGDLGFVRDGEIFITGRIKEVIIVRGRNFYPQDIELTAERSHPALRPHAGAAFSVKIGAEERLVIVQEIQRKEWREVDIAEVKGIIAEAIAVEYGISAHETVLVLPGTVPKTSSGKIRRIATRSAYLSGAFQAVNRADGQADSGQTHYN